MINILPLGQMSFRNNILRQYSQFAFLPSQFAKPLEIFWNDEIVCNSKESIEIIIDGKYHQFILKSMDWDSEFFKLKTKRIITVLYLHNDYSILKRAVNAFLTSNYVRNVKYWIFEAPSEDITLIQAFNDNGFRLVETRLCYYLELEHIDFPRSRTRTAIIEDIPNLRAVAKKMVNPYDRFHAEPYFKPELADDFLAIYAENSIRGLADCVLVPDEKGIPADSFVSAKYLKSYWNRLGCNVSNMVLSAVSAETNKGWYIRLITEMAYHLKDIGAAIAFMHPASTNKAVIHTYEKLGCKLGQVSHVFAKYI